jgi:hypothetical protein
VAVSEVPLVPVQRPVSRKGAQTVSSTPMMTSPPPGVAIPDDDGYSDSYDTDVEESDSKTGYPRVETGDGRRSPAHRASLSESIPKGADPSKAMRKKKKKTKTPKKTIPRTPRVFRVTRGSEAPPPPPPMDQLTAAVTWFGVSDAETAIALASDVERAMKERDSVLGPVLKSVARLQSVRAHSYREGETAIRQSTHELMKMMVQLKRQNVEVVSLVCAWRWVHAQAVHARQLSLAAQSGALPDPTTITLPIVHFRGTDILLRVVSDVDEASRCVPLLRELRMTDPHSIIGNPLMSPRPLGVLVESLPLPQGGAGESDAGLSVPFDPRAYMDDSDDEDSPEDAKEDVGPDRPVPTAAEALLRVLGSWGHPTAGDVAVRVARAFAAGGHVPPSSLEQTLARASAEALPRVGGSPPPSGGWELELCVEVLLVHHVAVRAGDARVVSYLDPTGAFPRVAAEWPTSIDSVASEAATGDSSGGPLKGPGWIGRMTAEERRSLELKRERRNAARAMAAEQRAQRERDAVASWPRDAAAVLRRTTFLEPVERRSHSPLQPTARKASPKRSRSPAPRVVVVSSAPSNSRSTTTLPKPVGADSTTTLLARAQETYGAQPMAAAALARHLARKRGDQHLPPGPAELERRRLRSMQTTRRAAPAPRATRPKTQGVVVPELSVASVESVASRHKGGPATPPAGARVIKTDAAASGRSGYGITDHRAPPFEADGGSGGKKFASPPSAVDHVSRELGLMSVQNPTSPGYDDDYASEEFGGSPSPAAKAATITDTTTLSSPPRDEYDEDFEATSPTSPPKQQRVKGTMLAASNSSKTDSYSDDET